MTKKENLKKGHVVHTLTQEHAEILKFLDSLDETNGVIQKAKSLNAAGKDLEFLKHIAHHLVGAEFHHKREEEVLFPEIEKRGISGPTNVMRQEHNELRKRKKEILELAESADKNNFEEFKEKLSQKTDFVVSVLRDHIYKEDNILYPMALEAIEDEATWRKMKLACDKIGYCCFTPLEV